MLVGGCAKTVTAPPPAPPPQPASTQQTAIDPLARVQTVLRLADTLARTSNALPGENVTEHRKLMAQIFAQLAELLPILEGPSPGAEFRQQLQIIRDAQGELATGPQNLIVDPIIDIGLRASRDALTGITQHGFYDQAKLAPVFERLAAKTNELDTVGGPLHQIVSAECVSLIGQIVSGMSDTFTTHVADSSPAPPASAPSTQMSGQ
jgi:hypothetical protein